MSAEELDTDDARIAWINAQRDAENDRAKRLIEDAKLSGIRAELDYRLGKAAKKLLLKTTPSALGAIIDRLLNSARELEGISMDELIPDLDQDKIYGAVLLNPRGTIEFARVDVNDIAANPTPVLILPAITIGWYFPHVSTPFYWNSSLTDPVSSSGAVSSRDFFSFDPVIWPGTVWSFTHLPQEPAK